MRRHDWRPTIGLRTSPVRGLRLTVYFALLGLLVAVAAAAAIVYVFVQTDRDSRHAAKKNTNFAARTAAKDLADGLALIQATVANVAATPNVEQSAEQPTCALTFGLSGGLGHGHVDVIRPDGSVACSSRARSGTTPLTGYTGATWLARAKAGPVLLAPILDTATGERSVLNATPTSKHWVVATFVALAPVGQGLVNVYGGGHPIEFLVTSGDGRTVLARSIDPGRWIGKPLAGTSFASSAGGTERRDLDGKPRLYSEAAIPKVGWKFFAGEDKAAALAAGSRLRERQLAIILAGLVLVLLAALVIYRRVAVPIRRLGASVRSTAALPSPEPVPVSGPAEVSDLGGDVNTLISSVNHELAQREQAEESALASERSYRQLFESSPLPMWIHDDEMFQIVAVNDAAVARYGYSRDEFLNLKTTDIAPDDEDPDNASSRHVDKNGADIKARTFTHAVMFDGVPARCVVAEDVGDRERLESQLRQAQKMEAVGHLAGGVAHDFNNLLTVISGYGAMARNRIGAGPGARELSEIERAAQRAAQLTGQLLTFSRQQILEPVVLDLDEVIAAVTPMLARLIGDDVEIAVLAAETAPKVLADRGQIEQVIVNLAVNARDAMPDGGIVTIETREERLDERYAAGHAGVEPGSYACLAVTDTGIGIDRETQALIFDPFFTTKDVGQGTGLGLATVHGIVKQSGGHIEVYSEAGLGTSFKVYLPAAAGEAAVPAYRPEQRPEQLGGTETVLVCEDDELVRVLFEAILTENGYKVLSASRPDEAFRLAAANAGSIDVLITDVVMPQMSGPELVERLEEVSPGMKVVLLSGYTAETLRNRGLPVGSVFIQKPFDDVSLLHTIRSLLDPVPGVTSL
jgi:PAS domain S-box-containing protein